MSNIVMMFCLNSNFVNIGIIAFYPGFTYIICISLNRNFSDFRVRCTLTGLVHLKTLFTTVGILFCDPYTALPCSPVGFFSLKACIIFIRIILFQDIVC